MVDVSKSTLEYLDELLAEVSDGMDVPSDWPPPQEKECMTVAALNLLNLQVQILFFVIKQMIGHNGACTRVEYEGTENRK